jgi:hypothetical protein
MTSPLPRFNLTFNLARAVNIVDGVQVAQTIEIAITPLATPSTPGSDLTLVGGTQEQTVLLNNTTNTAVFAIVPSNAPGLTEPMNYLCAMRQGGVTGAINETTFSMPNQDTAWEDLGNLGDLISGTIFLAWTDLGVAGRVAKLNDSGIPVDSNGDPVAMPTDVSTVNDALVSETEARIAGDASVTSAMTSAITTQAATTLSSAKSYTDTQVETLNASIGNEAGARANAITALTNTLTADDTALQGQITTNTNAITAIDTTLTHKADLDSNGYVPVNQTNPAVITSWIPVANQAAMLALTYPTQVQVGDVAYTATAMYVLLTTDPTQLANWRNITPVDSVNGKTGVVALTAADVGAVDASTGTVSISQVTGLSTALTGKAAQSDMAAAQAAIAAIQNDTTYVHTASGVIADSVMPVDAAFINSSNNLTKKDGTVIPIGSLSGVSSVNGNTGVVTITPANIGALATNGTITESQVTGLSTDLANRLLTTDASVTNARTPTAHAASHASGGSDAVTLSVGQITGLSTTLAGKAAQSDMVTAQSNIASLQSTVTAKADLTGPGNTVPVGEIPTFTGSAKLSDWGTKADLVSGTVPLSQTSQVIPQGYISGLNTTLAGKADLSGPGGTVNPAQLPTSALSATFEVGSQAAMLALAAHQGDICVITTGANVGTYRLATTDPTQLANWILLQFPSSVTSVNTHTGAVTLTAADVGAVDASTGTVSISQVTGLSTQLGLLATTSALNSAVAGLTTPAQVQTQLASSTPNKQTANYVATSAIASLAGQQSVDGVLTPIGSVVLATAQPSSVNNGLWLVNSGAWTRTSDFTTGSWLVKGTYVVVTQGTTKAETLWQNTATSGVIDTNVNNWSMVGSLGSALNYTAINGVKLTGTQFAGQAVAGGGVQVASGGFSIDPAVGVRKAVGTVPSTGSTIVQITHNLNNLAPWPVIVDTASGNIVDLGCTVINANIVSCEFASPPASGQYRYMIVG